MKNSKTAVLLLLLGLSSASTLRGSEPFAELRGRFADAKCLTIKFKSILESEIFRTVDSIDGRGDISSDGRFNIEVGDEEFVFDGNLLSTYSRANNQVTIEKSGEDSELSRGLTFLTNLDELFDTETLIAGKRYRLTRKAETPSSLPDLMVAVLSKNSSQLESIEYLDVNEDKNIIVFESIQIAEGCDAQLFTPVYPDSVEKIRMF